MLDLSYSGIVFQDRLVALKPQELNLLLDSWCKNRFDKNIFGKYVSSSNHYKQWTRVITYLLCMDSKLSNFYSGGIPKRTKMFK